MRKTPPPTTTTRLKAVRNVCDELGWSGHRNFRSTPGQLRAICLCARVCLVLGCAAQPAFASPSPTWQELDVPGFYPAVISVPDGTTPLPVVVATHGAGGTAEWHCEHFKQLLGEGVILLCPRGKRRNYRILSEGYYYPDHLALAREVHHSLVALATRYPERIQRGHLLYAGYSQGATMGILALSIMQLPLTRLLLVEGGFSGWTVSAVSVLQSAGLERTLFVCGTANCHRGAVASVGVIARAGGEAQQKYAAGAGHTPEGAVGERTEEGLPWVLEGW